MQLEMEMSMSRSSMLRAGVIASFAGYTCYFLFATLGDMMEIPLAKIVGLILAIQLWQIAGSAFLIWLDKGDVNSFAEKAKHSFMPFEYIIRLLTRLLKGPP